MSIERTPITTAFIKGMTEVSAGKKKELTAELKKALGITTRIQFAMYRDGKQQMTVPKMFAVWQTFARFGIADPWGGKVQ